jgi:hypothetical protein
MFMFMVTVVTFSRRAVASLQVNGFNPATLNSLMCTDTLSVAWKGRLYD